MTTRPPTRWLPRWPKWLPRFGRAAGMDVAAAGASTSVVPIADAPTPAVPKIHLTGVSTPMTSLSDRLHAEPGPEREQFIVNAFADNFGAAMAADPAAWRGKFRKMAATPFAFYRGSAALFYADMAHDEEPFVDEKTSRVWIQGDLHAENFGTYMNSQGIIVFDVNDFDEAYVAPFTWDLKRLAASLTLIGYEKAMSDDEIRQMIAMTVRSYVDQVHKFASGTETADFALTLDNTTGALKELLQESRLLTRVGLLDKLTGIVDYDRRFTMNKVQHPIDDATKAKVEAAFHQYLDTIPQRKRFGQVSYNLKDICQTRGIGIGSAGLEVYTLLVEGPTQSLENDILISMKQALTAAPSRAVADQNIHGYFLHDGHRTVLSQRALQAYADPWLGHTTLDGQGRLVAEISPYTNDLSWGDLNSLDEILELLGYMGRAVAKIHCVSDDDSDHTLVPFSIEEAIATGLAGREDAFVEAMIDFGHAYGDIVRDDYRLFVDAFRNHQFPGL